MQIVIDIPDGYVGVIMSNQKMAGSSMDKMIRQAIIDGTPLPKRHGRLIDADKVIEDATRGMKYPANYQYMECVIAYMKLAPTIIEADKESE